MSFSGWSGKLTTFGCSRRRRASSSSTFGGGLMYESMYGFDLNRIGRSSSFLSAGAKSYRDVSSRRLIATEWMSMRSSIDMQRSTNASTSSSPYRSTYPRMRAAWLAISSIIFRVVCAKYALFLKKSQWP
jgi:hypothetical protein